MHNYPAILYVEDDPMSRIVIEILLHEVMGLSNVVILEDSTDFEQTINSLSVEPDIILLDIHMKPLSGFEMLHILRHHPVYNTKPIVALTASVMSEEIDQLREAGFNGVLAKPLNEATFPDTLTRLLHGEYIWKI